ncbi:DNA-methyltransferase [Synechococcus sp. RC10B2]|uniref:DNA-methyltransferase n=1 Tax=Synechococcus sp. RC10B2 TaxID=2964530 RepID=UPI0039C6B9D5
MEAYIPPTDDEERVEALPQQEEFWRPPVRFGTIPVEKEPLGWDKRKGFYKLFPRVSLPFQIVERVSFGHPDLPANRLIWGDNLHVMRQLPSESIDLIYIDPPFFSGRQYNIIFGDQNEVRSFTDIWEGGMPGYLIWLNARLYEMKRLLKKTGSIYVHCDWHASHYIKVEMDKIFGYENFRNEIVWFYRRWTNVQSNFQRMHDVILFYSKSDRYLFNKVEIPVREYLQERKQKGWNSNTVESGGKRIRQLIVYDREAFTQAVQAGRVKPEEWDKIVYAEQRTLYAPDVWEIPFINPVAKERIGYPTQKPEALVERIIKASTQEGDVVADFFCGGGTTPAVAQRLGRQWIACDQSRVAVAVTADRLIRGAQQLQMDLAIPDFTVEYWGVYEARRLTQMPEGEFRPFILRCFGATPNTDPNEPHIHGYKGSVPVWVCPPDARYEVRHTDVVAFANAVRRSIRYQQSDLREGIMLGWAFTPEAREAAEQLRRRAGVDVNFIRLELIRIDSPRFRQHVAKLSTNHADYENFLTFIQPPRVEVGYERVASLTYRFDVSDTVVVNLGARIINVQWDFDYDGRQFRSTQGYALSKASEPVVYKFPRAGKFTIACKVQDDKGGEAMWVGELEVS